MLQSIALALMHFRHEQKNDWNCHKLGFHKCLHCLHIPDKVCGKASHISHIQLQNATTSHLERNITKEIEYKNECNLFQVHFCKPVFVSQIDSAVQVTMFIID